MPFLMNCQCGKKLRVADENEGKKVRCPACQALVLARPEPAAKAAAPKAAREMEPGAKRRPAPPEEEANGETQPKRPRRDEAEDEEPPARKRKPEPEEDEDRPARKPSRKTDPDDEDEGPAQPKRKKGARDDDGDEDDRPAKKTKKSGSKAWLWAGCGCSSLLFLGCAGVIVLAALFGGKKSPEAQLAGSWELDRDSGAPIPDQFVKYKTFGFEFNKDGTFREDWDGSIHEGKWRADKGNDPDPVYAFVTYPPNTSPTVLRFRPQDDKDRLVFNHAGALVPLKRTDRQIGEGKGDTKQPGGDSKVGKGGGKPKSLVFLKEHTKDVTSLAFWGDDLLASASWDGTVKVWQLPAEKSKYTFKGHTGQARSVAFLDNGQALASGGGNPDPSAKGGEVKLWDLANGTEKSTPYKGERPVESVAANRNGRILAWSNFSDVVVWDVNGNKQAATLPGHSFDVAAVAIPETARGLSVAVAGGQELKIWDMPTIAAKPGKPANVPTAARLTLKTQYMIHSVAFSPDGLFVAAGGDGAVTVWEVGSGAQKWTAKTLEGGDAKGVAFSRDGQALAAACGTVQFWVVATGADLGEWKSEFAEGHYPYSVAFSSDGKKMATGALNGTIKVWDFSTPPAPKR